MKKCSACKEFKSLSEFHNDKNKWDGKVIYCKECRLEKQRKDRVFHAEPKLKKDGTPDKRFLRRKEGYGLPYGQRPQRKAWYLKNKESLNERSRQYRIDNWELLKVKKKEYLDKIREEGIEVYGGKCACCGEATHEFLTIDHINGRSPDEVKHGGRNVKGKKLFLHLKSLGWPKENYQLLCWNCNCAKGLYGKCPHQGGDAK